MTLSSDLVIDQQSIGVASEAQGFQGVDGILGIGPVDLTEGTVSDEQPVPTVTDNLLSSGAISTAVIGIYYVPAAESSSGGELDFGAKLVFVMSLTTIVAYQLFVSDSSKYTGDIAYVPITSTSPASAYWGIDQSISYGDSSILSTTAGIVDTGRLKYKSNLNGVNLIIPNVLRHYLSSHCEWCVSLSLPPLSFKLTMVIVNNF